MRYLAAVPHDPDGATMERHELEALLAGDDEATVTALAALRSGAPYSVEERVQPTGAHAGVLSRRLQRLRRQGIEPPGLERAVRLIREHGRPVRSALIDPDNRTRFTLLFLTEDRSALVACVSWTRPLVVREPPLCPESYSNRDGRPDHPLGSLDR